MGGIFIMVRGSLLNALIIFLLVLLSGCGDEKFGGSDSLLSDVSIEELYFSNKDAVKSLVDFCVSNPSVKWLGVNSERVSLSTVLNLKPDIAAVIEARNTVANIGGQSLVCSRNWQDLDYPLLAVMVSLDNIGISVSGSSKGIIYFFKFGDHVDSMIKTGSLKSLGDEGWYIYLSK
jgi:hypothetical protein